MGEVVVRLAAREQKNIPLRLIFVVTCLMFAPLLGKSRPGGLAQLVERPDRIGKVNGWNHIFEVTGD